MSPPIDMTRADATAAFNAIAAIGQYQTTAKQGGQDVAVTKFLDVSAAMRSTLVHDTTVLRGVLMETAKLQEDAKARDAKDPATYAKEVEAIATEKVKVDGLILFKESDLAFDKNPQITPLLGSALSVLETK